MNITPKNYREACQRIADMQHRHYGYTVSTVDDLCEGIMANHAEQMVKGASPEMIFYQAQLAYEYYCGLTLSDVDSVEVAA